MFDARTGPIKFVFKIIITNGIGMIMAHHQVTLCRCEQLPVGSAFRFGICCSFSGPGVHLDEFINAFSQPEFVYKINVEPVAKVFLH